MVNWLIRLFIKSRGWENRSITDGNPRTQTENIKDMDNDLYGNAV